MLSIQTNIKEFKVAFAKFTHSVVPEVTAMALNDTAYDGLDAVKKEMTDKFDSPTRWTLNAWMVWRADAKTLRAEVKPRPSMGRRHYLKVQVAGGVRPHTGVEGALRGRLKYAGNIASVTPAKGARLDASGNWSSGQRNQVLSGVQAQRDATSNTTKGSRTRAKKRAQYFVPKPGSGLSPGVWQRDGDTLSKVLHFTQSASSYGDRKSVV